MMNKCKICGKKIPKGYKRKFYCSDECARNARNEQAKKWGRAHAKGKVKGKKVTCPICKKEFIQAHNKVYCSLDCSIAAAKIKNKNGYKKKEKQEKMCPICGKVFMGNAKRKYCSNQCAMFASGYKIYAEKVKAEPKEDLKTAADNAKALGLSYGEYVARERM